MQNLTDRIKKKAQELGFIKVGIAKAEPLREESDHLSEWLSQGFHATMGWMVNNPEKRSNPQNVLPEAKSVISVALNYYTGHQHSDDKSVGKISRYAWGDDYHDILTKKLNLLLEFIQTEEKSAIGKVYVDTGPVMEKVWAERAGIGWIGKHTNLITQDYGSWVFLGEIILNVELQYDTPATDHCGECTLCIEACPTQAITEPYVLDSNLCISYLTIEHRGEVAKELDDKFQNWIYGCDICQDVCPWNHKFSRETAINEFQPREYNIAPDLENLVQMSQKDFSERFHKSPIKRTKHVGLVRNAKIVLSSQHSA